MKAANLLDILIEGGIHSYCGVPDSLLSPFTDELTRRFGEAGVMHNEGGGVAYAVGYHLATGKIPLVYLQNSGLGNIINPVCSITSPLVYGIPILYVVGFRGEANVADEPQHVFQGSVTREQLALLDIATFYIGPDTSEDDLRCALGRFQALFTMGKSAAILIGKASFEAVQGHAYKNAWSIIREAAIERIALSTQNDIIVSSTGKISRELFELREKHGLSHRQDFLCVGAMGHDSMIALGIGLGAKERIIWCIQGDGAFLMHMGQAATIGAQAPPNLRHIVLNNAAHESVGGLPSVAAALDLCAIAKACGYQKVFCVEQMDELDACLGEMRNGNALSFMEIRCAMDSRRNLIRPSLTPAENKEMLMNNMKAVAERT